MPPEGEKMESRERLTALRLRLEISNRGAGRAAGGASGGCRAVCAGLHGAGPSAAALEGTVLELAMLRYRRRGMEGETVHSEGGLQMSMEGLPAALEKLLNRYRKARAV